jgi:uncharacterized protein DUF6064
MKLPFTVEQFFDTLVRYNLSVWPMQIILIGLAIAVIILLFRARYYNSRLIAAVLSFFWAWMAIAYHFTFFTAINPAASFFGGFFLVGALWFAWIGVLKNKLQFSLHGGIRAWLGGLLIVFSLIIYPLIGFLFGHRYPATPTFGLPCPTTIFTLGILLFGVVPFPRSVFIVPVLWSAIGSFAAFQLRVPQDYGLLIAGLIGLMAAILPARTANHAMHQIADKSGSR